MSEAGNGRPTSSIPGRVDANFIAGMANRIIETLSLMNITTEMRQSILTTAFVNHTKILVRESPPDAFENDKGAVVSLLETIAKDIQKIRPPVPNARQSQDDPRPT